jgi:hypothetical protein
VTTTPVANHDSTRLPVAAAAACWLAREDGLPRIYGLRWAIVQRHAGPCAYCAIDAADLIAGITTWLADNDPLSRFDRDGVLMDRPRQVRAAA